MARQRGPSKQELAAARDSETVPDIVGPGMSLLFIGINPGLYSGATGHHFARPGNRFWPALYRAGLTPRLLHPSEEAELLGFGVGLTKLVHRATATAAELKDEELRAGGARIRRMVTRYKPRLACFLGVGAYNQAYGLKGTAVGVQDEPLGRAELWVLPNPSGLNANYQMPDFVRLFTQVRDAAGLPDRRA